MLNLNTESYKNNHIYDFYNYQKYKPFRFRSSISKLKLLNESNFSIIDECLKRWHCRRNLKFFIQTRVHQFSIDKDNNKVDLGYADIIPVVNTEIFLSLLKRSNKSLRYTLYNMSSLKSHLPYTLYNMSSLY